MPYPGHLSVVATDHYSVKGRAGLWPQSRSACRITDRRDLP